MFGHGRDFGLQCLVVAIPRRPGRFSPAATAASVRVFSARRVESPVEAESAAAQSRRRSRIQAGRDDRSSSAFALSFSAASVKVESSGSCRRRRSRGRLDDARHDLADDSERPGRPGGRNGEAGLIRPRTSAAIRCGFLGLDDGLAPSAMARAAAAACARGRGAGRRFRAIRRILWCPGNAALGHLPAARTTAPSSNRLAERQGLARAVSTGLTAAATSRRLSRARRICRRSSFQCGHSAVMAFERSTIF